MTEYLAITAVYCCLLLFIMLYIVAFGSNIILTYVAIISTSAWLRDSILFCIVPLFNCSLTSLKRMAVTRAVQSDYSPKW